MEINLKGDHALLLLALIVAFFVLCIYWCYSVYKDYNTKLEIFKRDIIWKKNTDFRRETVRLNRIIKEQKEYIDNMENKDNNTGSLTVQAMVESAHKNALDHGWHEEKRTFGELIALCHSELSEALEDYREGFDLLDTWEEEVSNKPCGIPSELADVVIRIADMCGLYGIDLEEAIKIKMEYNKTRPYKHGNKKI